MQRNRFRRARNLSLILATTVLLTAGCVKDDDKVAEVEIEETQKDSPKASDVNLTSALVTFLNDRSKTEKRAVQTIITDNFDSVTGIYAYAAKVTKDEKGTVTIDLGPSTLNVPKNKVVSYNNFLGSVSELKDNAEGLAIITYNNNIVESVEMYQLDHKVDVVRNALSEYDAKAFKADKKEKKKEDLSNPYASSTMDDWKGMALLTARDVVSKDMAPIFLVPKNSFTREELLTDTFYYIIAGTLKSSNEKETTLVTDTGRIITMDFGKEVTDDQLNTPSWVHVITNDGEIANIEIQSFKGADIELMSDGVRSYIEVGSVLDSADKAE